MNAPTPAIQVENLSYAYGSAEAVHDLSLTVQPGRCYGLFGRNGAGKTTTMKCLLNLLRPQSGQVRVFGLDPAKDEVAVKRSDPIYNAHGYLTKVPVAAIEPFILAFTDPGDVVLDPFAGSGMTGVAAAVTGLGAPLAATAALDAPSTLNVGVTSFGSGPVASSGSGIGIANR